ncbi:PREDICTED: uncharacterized protein LOC105002708 [Bison bison bison]|uniref:Uncharacterized protein LOC105002708 n=1 Tax=Bison bison bison TaxID=43346 RepID=A0A6P3IU40_BISBB|nr:PREDICTED: uncharacterized protein LOC105002708 [Bison bison bison]
MCTLGGREARAQAGARGQSRAPSQWEGHWTSSSWPRRASAGDDGAGSVPLSSERRRSHVSSGVLVPASHGGQAARTRTEGYDMVRCDGESRRDRPASQDTGPAGSPDIDVPLVS